MIEVLKGKTTYIHLSKGEASDLLQVTEKINLISRPFLRSESPTSVLYRNVNQLHSSYGKDR
jgi:hypothetical protein